MDPDVEQNNIDIVRNFKKKLDKGVSFEKTMHILYKLQKIPITIRLLEDTGIGFKIREISKKEKDSDVGKMAKLLILNWKGFVRSHPRESEDDTNEAEMESQQEFDDGRSNDEHLEHSPAQNDGYRHHYKNSKKSAAVRSDEDSEDSEPDSEDDERREHKTNAQRFANSSIHSRHSATARHGLPEDDSEQSSVETNSIVNSNSNDRSSHKSKKHKKKHKKKSSKNEYEQDDSELEITVKKTKKRHREEEEDSETSQHKSKSTLPLQASHKSANHCDTNQVAKSNQVKRSKHSFTSGGNQPVDMFGTMLGLGDQLALGSSYKVPTISKSSAGKVGSAMPSIASKSVNFDTPSMRTSDKQRTSSATQLMAMPHSSTSTSYRPEKSRNRLPAVLDDFAFESSRPSSAGSSSGNKSAGSVDPGFYYGMKMKHRTAVYAGSSKSVTKITQVFSLQDLCIQILMNHIDKIDQVGDLPYFILKPVLLKCTVSQLRRIESINPQLVEETDELWQEFCTKDFKNHHRGNHDTWRDHYAYLVNEREQKLKNITKSIKAKEVKAIPERKTQQIDLRTPREIRRRQERSSNPVYTQNSSSTISRGSSANSVSAISLASVKPKKAPLMQKLLKLKKSSFRR